MGPNRTYRHQLHAKRRQLIEDSPLTLNLSPPVTDIARPFRSDDVGRIIRFMLSLNQLEFKPLQKDAPDDFYLLIRERQSNTTMPAASKADQPVRTFAVFFTPGSESIGVIAFRFTENVR